MRSSESGKRFGFWYVMSFLLSSYTDKQSKRSASAYFLLYLGSALTRNFIIIPGDTGRRIRHPGAIDGWDAPVSDQLGRVPFNPFIATRHRFSINGFHILSILSLAMREKRDYKTVFYWSTRVTWCCHQEGDSWEARKLQGHKSRKNPSLFLWWSMLSWGFKGY